MKCYTIARKLLTSNERCLLISVGDIIQSYYFNMMYLMNFCKNLQFICLPLLIASINIGNAETISAYKIKMYTLGHAFTFNDDRTIMENTWQEACIARHLKITKLPNASYCVSDSGQAVYPQGGDLCADGSFKIPIDFGWCNEVISECPNSTWELSIDKNTCSRPDDACWKDIDNTSEIKLLAAIAYGESHWSNVYEEMAGIASAVVRRRDAAHLETTTDLVKKNDTFSYVVYNGNERFIKLMCGDEKNFKKAYEAALNALNYGEDYSEGGCFWDGYDLKTSGNNHYKYRSGFKYSDPSHNIFSTPEPPLAKRKGHKKGFYYTTYLSTTTQGRTIFWKLDKQFLKANGAVQCN